MWVRNPQPHVVFLSLPPSCSLPTLLQGSGNGPKQERLTHGSFQRLGKFTEPQRAVHTLTSGTEWPNTLGEEPESQRSLESRGERVDGFLCLDHQVLQGKWQVAMMCLTEDCGG